MLYQVYETQRSMFEPFAEFAQAAAKLYNNPISPFSQTALTSSSGIGSVIQQRPYHSGVTLTSSQMQRTQEINIHSIDQIRKLGSDEITTRSVFDSVQYAALRRVRQHAVGA